MPFCVNCGKQLNENDKFCNNCGAQQRVSNDKGSQYSETRKNVYVGTVRKCPSCGAELSSFSAICPQCGHELNSVEVPKSIKEFSKQLSILDNEIANSLQIKTWRNWDESKKFWWVVLNILLLGVPLLIYLLTPLAGIGKSGKFSPAEKRKEAFINNYTFPNDRENVIEALLLIKSQVTALSMERKNWKTKKWILIWETKAKQLINKTDLLFKEDSVASNTYNEIVTVYKNAKKTVRIKSIILLTLIVVCSSVSIISITRFINGINEYFGSGISLFNFDLDKQNTDLEKLTIPTIGEDTETNEKEGIFSSQIRNYIGQNVASIGKQETDYLVDEYGDGELRISFVTENGLLISDDKEIKKNYVVVEQNIPAGTTFTLVNKRSRDGHIYSNLVSYQNYDEIVLYVAPVNKDSYHPKFTTINPTLDRHKYHIRDYVGRNAASFGTGDYENKRIDEYGDAELKIHFTSEDRSFVDDSDINILKQYIVTNQDIAVNTDLRIFYETDSSGIEYDSLVKSQNFEAITLTIKKLDESIIKQQPTLSSQSTNDKDDYKDLTVKYNVELDRSATISGFEGDGNHATIYDSIDGHEVKAIGKSAFKDCKSLESILCWAEIEKIDDYAFSGCSELKEISISIETKTIGNHAFENCTALETVLLWGDPNIGEYAFSGCSSIKSLSIGNDTKEIGQHAFDGCTNLESVIIWNDNTIVGKDAFANCPKLKERPIQE